MLRFILVLFFLFTSLHIHAEPYMLKIEQSLLQEQIDDAMPIEKSNIFGTALINHPQLQLNGKQNKIEFWVDFDAVILKKINAIGTSKISADLYYKHEEGAFYLYEPVIEELNIEKVNEKHIPIYQKLIQAVLKNRLKKHAIYRFDETDMKQKFAKASLKSVAIGDEELIVVMDMGL